MKEWQWVGINAMAREGSRHGYTVGHEKGKKKAGLYRVEGEDYARVAAFDTPRSALVFGITLGLLLVADQQHADQFDELFDAATNDYNL